MSWHRSLILFPALVLLFELLPQQALQARPEVLVSVKFPPTVNRGSVPSSTAGGGTRRGVSSCTQQSQAPLTALMPSNNIGTTVAPRPTFFLYVPKITSKAPSVEFTLVDERENDVYETTLALTSTPGIINLTLPANKSLEVGKTYNWQFTLICDPQDPSSEEFEFVEGSIRRTELSPYIKTKIINASPLEKAKLYANMGIWHETLTIVSVLRNSRPSEWSELLHSVGLDAIASAPFARYRIAEN